MYIPQSSTQYQWEKHAWESCGLFFWTFSSFKFALTLWNVTWGENKKNEIWTSYRKIIKKGHYIIVIIITRTDMENEILILPVIALIG